MKKRYLILFSVGIVVFGIVLAGLSRSSQAQDTNFRVLLPDVMDSGELGEAVRQETYAVLIGPRETVHVTMTRTSGNVIPHLILYNDENEFITEEKPDDDATVSIELEFEVSQPGWYFIVATSKESVRFAFAEGTYNIILVGTTYRTFEALNLSIPPRLENAQIFRGSDELETVFEPARRFLVELEPGGEVTLQTNTNTTNITFFNRTERRLSSTISNNVNFSDDDGGWFIIEIHAPNNTAPVTLTVTLTSSSGRTIENEPILVSRLPEVVFEGFEETGQATALPTRGPTCEVTALDNANRRSGPGMQYSVESALRYGSTRTVIAQSVDEANWIWWQLEDKSWVREDSVSEGDGCDRVALIVLEETFVPPTPSEGIEASVLCVLTAINEGNKRVGPGVDYAVGAPLRVGAQEQAIGQYEPRGRQERWWQTEDELWVREDLVTEEGDCEDLETTWP